MKLNVLKISFILMISFLASNAWAEVNSKSNIEKIKNESNYSFIVLGHAYGAPSSSVFPAASLLSGTQEINQQKPNFVILLGDTIQHANSPHNIYNSSKDEVQKFNDAQFDSLKKLFIDKIDSPILNVAGNHDAPESDWYKSKFGKTNFKFTVNSEAYIMFNSMNLCSEKNKLNIEEKFILENLKNYKNNDKIKNIFLLMHQAIFTSEKNELSEVKNWVNGGLAKCPSYTDKILPKLEELSEKINIYLVAGDTGCKDYQLGAAPLDTFPIFFHERGNISYLISGICENSNDNFVNIKLENGKVDFQAISFLDGTMKKVQSYNILYWKKHYSSWDQQQKIFEKKHQLEIFKKDVPLKKIEKIIKLIKDIFRSKKFYAGIIFSFIIFFFFKRFIRIFSEKR